MTRINIAFRKAALMSAGAALIALHVVGDAEAQPVAQEGKVQSGETTTLDTIIVTSNRREENIRDLAGSVDVISGDMLEEVSAAGFEDYLKLVPSVQLNDVGVAQSSNITIRGVSTGASVGISQQTVGIYVNETPFTDVFGFLSSPDLSPFDLERVEVLRGPQGALYGSGSMGGAIRYITTKPQLGEFAAKYNGLISFTEDGGTNSLNQGMLNFPVSDTFAFRTVLGYRTGGGYVDNTLTGEKDSDDLDQLHARASALWAPSQRLSLLATYIYQDTETDNTSLIEDPSGERLETSISPFASLELKYQIASLELKYDSGFADWFVSGSFASKDRDVKTDVGPMSVTTTLAGLDAGLTAALSPIGAYSPGDLFSAGVEENLLLSQPTSDAYFVEARLMSKSEQRLRWMIGGLYSRIETENPIQQLLPGLNSALSAYEILPPFDALYGAPNAAVLFGIPQNDRLLDLLQKSEAQELAVYGEVQFDITDRLELAAGGRYFDYDVDTQLALGGASLADIDNSVSKFQPRLSIGYRPSDDVLTYFVFSRGYRVGGVNDTVALTLAPGDSIEDSPAPLTYSTDNLYNYEVGAKTAWLDGALTADIGVYYIDWSDIQLSAYFPAPLTPTGGVAAITNAGDASILGVEAQIVAQLNDDLTLSSSISYNDAKLDSDSPMVPSTETGLLTFAPEGSQLPGSREWQMSNSVTLNRTIFEVPVSFVATHQYASGTTNDFVIQAPLKGYNLFDLRFDAQLTENARLGLFVKNVTDERETVQISPASPGFSPRQYVVTRPRTVGLNISVDF